MSNTGFRLLKAGDTIAYLGLLWLSWRFVDGELHWRLSIGAVVLAGGWLLLTSVRINRLLATYFDVLSRLEVVIPAALGIALALFALVRSPHLATRAVAVLELGGWGVLLLRYRHNRRLFVRQGHGPVPAGCWVSPPATALEPGDLILTSGMVAAGLRESVGHGETVLRLGDGALVSFTSRMDQGALLHDVGAFTSALRTHGHYIVLRLRKELSPEQIRQAARIAEEMIAANQRWAGRVNHRREAIVAQLPLPAAWKAHLKYAQTRAANELQLRKVEHDVLDLTAEHRRELAFEIRRSRSVETAGEFYGCSGNVLSGLGFDVDFEWHTFFGLS
jgi:hypothetical protein